MSHPRNSLSTLFLRTLPGPCLALCLSLCLAIIPARGTAANPWPPLPAPPASVQAAVQALARAATAPNPERGEALTLQVLSPNETQRRTARNSVHIAGRTAPGYRAFIGDQEVPVGFSGVFVRDQVPLTEGPNTITLRVQNRQGRSRQTVLQLERHAPAPATAPAMPAPSWEAGSLQPQGAWVLRATETLPLQLRARRASRVSVQVGDGGWQALRPYPVGDGEGDREGLWAWYSGELLPPAPGALEQPVAVQLRVETAVGTVHTEALPLTVAAWAVPRPYVVAEGGSELTWGLHEVRLGGPNLAELPAGTRVMVDGQRGEHLRVRLTADYEGWAPARNLRPLQETRPAPAFTLNNLMLTGGSHGDTLAVPWNPRVPFAVRQERGADGRPVIELEFFGGHLAATWLVQRQQPQVVEALQVDQTQRERPLARLTLRNPVLWGYEVSADGPSLRLQLRGAPPHKPARGQPLRGLRIALEAGHGGPTNPGATGITGTLEKDINLATTWLLQQELQSLGASVFMVREGEENPSGRERARLAVDSGAHLFVSVHANAASTEGGFLRAKGASVYYKHEHSRLLAHAIHRRFLAATGLPDFGLVGNFNYSPIRLNTAMPAVLVELAFLSNPQEEARMLDPAFRQVMARAIGRGIVDHVCQMARPACPR